MYKIPLSLYIHIPWCIRKCPYCDFNSHALKENLPEHAYLDAMAADLLQDLPMVQDRMIESIFIGGGTPSLLSGQTINDLIQVIKKHVRLVDHCEITLEANPGTLDCKYLREYKKAGVNRISLGVQSFQPTQLKHLGRIHSSDEAKRAIHSLQAAGFSNFNIDLMHSLENQTVEEAIKDLEQAISFSPPHLSWYALTIEPNTFFHRYPPQLPDHETQWEIYNKGRELLIKSGYQHYEVSAYSKTEYQCQHNLNYWQFGDYLGVGAGAHSKITDENTLQITRASKHRHPKDYLDEKKRFIAEKRIVSKEDIQFEFMLNALRLNQILPIRLYESRTGLSVSSIEKTLMEAKEKRLMTYDKKNIYITPLGQRFLNDLMDLFLPTN